MRSKLSLLAVAAALAGCQHGVDVPQRGLAAVNVPTVSRSDYVFDIAAPYGALGPAEAARLDNWFRSLDLRYGDMIYLDGPHAASARSDVARLAGRYGMLVSSGAPMTTGQVGPDTVRVIVSRSRAEMAGCPNWGVPAQPNYDNRTMPNYGCSVNGNLAAMVANPQDLVHGRDDVGGSDSVAAAKAIDMYRNWPLTGIVDGQQKRPLKDVSTKKDEN